MMKTSLVALLFLVGFQAEAEVGRKYFTEFLGHVHKNMSKDSASKTIVQCSHSVKILKVMEGAPDWTYVQVGEDKGYIQSAYLSESKPECLQGKYPEFYKNLNLDITEMYYWGKLYDQYFRGKSKIK
ncbi:MAG: hypothetical protein CME62_10620 [Halobacteriovoraceae bacterium]|nr:hypothetical protein [Halobacteriovoraceae bacterium]|tara:strand:- start:1023 stop:1403 length:381 start_codon:yes stop_codon:yes gene_type:complete